MIAPKRALSSQRWSHYVRGDIYEPKSPRNARGAEQRGNRFAVVIQSDALLLSTWIVAPTSTSANAASFRPEIEVEGTSTLVLLEQATAVDPQRLGRLVGRISHLEREYLDAALREVLDL